MYHNNYFEINANSYYELGLQEGILFGDHLRDSIDEVKPSQRWNRRLLDQAFSYLEITKKVFPRFVEELEGYSTGAGVSFDDLWIISLEDELFDTEYDKCTTIITNNGLLVAHNEDWDAEAKDSICVLKKRIGDLTILELFYLDTLGGNSISINSHGLVQTINTLSHTDRQLGIPKNVISRWLSETKDPLSDFSQLKKIKRSSGYNHNFVDVEGRLCNIECSAREQKLTRPQSPFVHTNHYLTALSRLDTEDNSCGTWSRYEHALYSLEGHMSVDSVKQLMSDSSKGKNLSIFNQMTIARMIIDLRQMEAYIWLLRENSKGWLRYELDFISSRL